MRCIYLQPIGEIEEELLDYLVAGLEKVYDYPVRVARPIGVPGSSYSSDRDQYNAGDITAEVAENMPEDAEKLLGVIDVDLFVPGLNFVFGLASGSAAVISLTRLRTEYRNGSLLRERALKEAIHELGHTFGLHHCPDARCIMHFSNTLADTDIKGPGFCSACSVRLGRILNRAPARA